MNKTLATGYLLILAGTLLGLSAPRLDGRVLTALIAMTLGLFVALRELRRTQ